MKLAKFLVLGWYCCSSYACCSSFYADRGWDSGTGLYPSLTDKKSDFEPYADHGGTVVAIAGPDYVMIAADNRMSDKYLIKSRSLSRIFEVAPGTVFSASGCWPDISELYSSLTAEVVSYEWQSGSQLDCSALAHFLGHQLFDRRFFPFFSFCLLAGFDKNGRPAVYKYDAVGSYEQVAAACAGKGEQMIQPLLDEISNLEEDDGLWTAADTEDSFVSNKRGLDVAQEKALSLIVKGFRAAAEREISIGDGFDVWIMSKIAEKNGNISIKKLHFPLPRH